MKRVLVSVEGQTEETFLRDVLRPHLVEFDILIDWRSLGGIKAYPKVQREVRRLFLDHGAVAITTMYDLFRLPPDFPGYTTKPQNDAYAKVRHLEVALSQDIANRRFRPYIQLHEFEALLFADPAKTAAQFPEADRTRELQAIRAAFASPEEINEGAETAPSKRLLALYPGYQKTFHGPLAASDIGLEVLRRECPHFRAWLEWLESLGEKH